MFHRDENNDEIDSAADAYQCNECGANFLIGGIMILDAVNPSPGWSGVRLVAPKFCPNCGAA